MRAVATILAACGALAMPLAAPAAEAAKLTGECTGAMITDFVSSDATDATTSTDWVEVTDGRVNFVSGRRGCVVVTFAAPAYAYSSPDADYNTLHVRAVLDRNTLCLPPAYSDAFSQDRYPTSTKANSIVVVCANVAAGGHRIQVQYRSDRTSDQVVIQSHVLTVAHR